MAELPIVPNQAEPLVEWLEPSLYDTAGRDPLGLNTITLDGVLPQLVPGILQLSERARYFSIYPWMLWQFQERKRPATSDELDKFIRRREYELCIAMKLCTRCDASKAIGSLSAGPRVRAGDDPFGRGFSVESSKGGFGLYYRTPLEDLGAVAPVGTPLGEDAKPTPIEVLLKTDRALALATSFHEAIKDTEYFQRYERTDEPIPRPVMEELAESVCLCRLEERMAERQAIRSLLFDPPAEEAEDACRTRRQAFALLLAQIDRNGEVAFEIGEFWRGVIDQFLRAPSGEGVERETVAAWGALAMKECMQDALCSVWTEFCRTGMQRQDLDGLTRDEVAFLIRDLAAGPLPDLGETTLQCRADESAVLVQSRAVEAARDLDWEDVRAWAEDANTAAAGLIALLVYAERLPDPREVHPLWTEIAQRHSHYQDGLYGVLSLLTHRTASDPTVADLLGWVVDRFIIGPHEAIAYSKLPRATFRFCWEETGRLRFSSPGGGGSDRFNPSDDRRGAMASLTEDLGYWSYDEETDTVALTADGTDFAADVLG